jgi:anaerobic magnesium-protoporphyrin IX monomethyl ester cyclase
MKICLINPTNVNRNWGNSFPPLGIGYLAAAALKAGHEVIVIDRDLQLAKTSDLDRVNAYTEAALLAFQPELIGLGVTTPLIPDAYKTARLVRRILPTAKIVIGGIHATILPQRVLEECRELDYVVVGEGEATFQELIGGLMVAQIRGLGYREGERIVLNPPRSLIEDIDMISQPARHLFNMREYTARSKYLIRGVSLRGTSIFTTRGCPYHCAFCAGPLVFGKKVRFHSVERVLGEIESLIDDYKIEGLYFADDMFSAKRDRALAICNELIGRGISKKLVFAVQLKASAVDEGLLRRLKQAGCIQVEYGFESGSQKILDLMNKGIKVEQNYQAAELSKKAGLRFLANIITGMPGETEDDYRATQEFLSAVKPDVVGFYKLILLPGSKLYLDLVPPGSEQPWENFTQDDLTTNYTAIPDRLYFDRYKKDFRRLALGNARRYFSYNLKRAPLMTLQETLGLIINKIAKR